MTVPPGSTSSIRVPVLRPPHVASVFLNKVSCTLACSNDTRPGITIVPAASPEKRTASLGARCERRLDSEVVLVLDAVSGEHRIRVKAA